MQRWLGDIDETAKLCADGNEYPSEIKHRLIYVIDIEQARNGFPGRAFLRPMVAILRKGGDLGLNANSYTPSNIFKHQPAKHLRPIDHEILAELDTLMRRNASPGRLGLQLNSHPQIARLMPKLLSTGRCRLGGVQGPILQEGMTQNATLRWLRVDGATGRQRLIMDPEPDSDGVIATLDAVLPLAPPYYVDTKTGLVGPLDLGLPPALAARLAEAPEVLPSEATQLTVALDQRVTAIGINAKLPLPEPPQESELRNILPVPRIELCVGEVRIEQQYSWYIKEPQHHGAFKLPLARLAFDYDGEVVPFHDRSETLERLDNDLLILTPRNGLLELNALDRLGDYGLRP